MTARTKNSPKILLKLKQACPKSFSLILTLNHFKTMIRITLSFKNNILDCFWSWYRFEEISPHAGNVTTRQLQREVLLNTSVQFMKERNTHAGNATTRQLQRVILINTSVQYMKERSIHAGHVTTRQLQREVLLNTSVQFIYKLIHVEQYRRIRSWPVMRGILSLFFNVQNVKMCLPLLEPIKASRILT